MVCYPALWKIICSNFCRSISGDRSAKIRTYNFPQGRVTDHRINFTSYRLSEIMNGDIEEIIEKLKIAEQQDILSAEID